MPCAFPWTGASCDATIGERLASTYSAYVVLYSLLTVAVGLPTLGAVAWQCSRRGSLATPSLDRPDALLVRVAFALVAFLIQTPDPLGYYAILPVGALELTSALTSLVLASVALSLVFRAYRSLLLLCDDGLSQIAGLTRAYTMTQYAVVALWIAFPVAQVCASASASPILKLAPILATVVVLVVAHVSASAAAIVAVQRMTRSATTSSTVSAVTCQTRMRAHHACRTVCLSTLALLCLFVPVTLARVVTIAGRGVYPDPTLLPRTFADLVLLSLFRLMKLLFAAGVAAWAMHRTAAGAFDVGAGPGARLHAQQTTSYFLRSANADVTVAIELVDALRSRVAVVEAGVDGKAASLPTF
ncbi:Uncharacterized protein PBTT_10029 [Plasmodiophora brassicae]